MVSSFINPVKYFSDECPFPDFQRNISNCASSMTQLIERYNIKNKKVLSLACGNGFEEYHFLQHGNSLVMSDADLPYGTIKPWVEKCSVQHDTGVSFNIEDCREAPNRYSNKAKFDVIYISSLHPDEVYRGRIQSNYIKSNLLKSLFTFKTFPKMDFYSEYVTPIFSILKPGGIIIMQHYGFTVPIALNESLIPNCSEHLNQFGLSHLETWAFKNNTGNCLNVFGKMNEDNAKELVTNLNGKPEISMLNGRYTAMLSSKERNILKVYVQNKKLINFGFFDKIMPFVHQLYRAFKYKLND
jgi:hypothetical protein